MSENTAGDSGTRGDSSPEPDADAAEGTVDDRSARATDDRPTVYDLAPDCTLEDAAVDELYHAEVNGVVDYGVFVDLSDAVSGLVHESNLDGDYAVGDRLIVRLTEVKENGDVAFDDVDPDDYRTETVAHEPTVSRVRGLAPGDEVTVEGEVVQAKQTGGPTIFAVADASGVLSCAAFESAGVRAYPEVEVGDMVHVSGTIESREGALQLEVDSLERLPDERAAEARERFEAALDERAEPADVDPLVEWEAFEPIHEDLRELARLLRRTVFSGRPIRVRHHADGDGMCAAIPVQLAVENLIEEVHGDPDSPRHLLKRLPSKAPYYEMEDVTRDLNFALEGRARHGQKLPFLLMLDNGSTEEDVPAYENLAHYDIPIAAVDHHHPDPEAVEPLLDAHVNPYLHGEDYRVTTGMMCVELARLVDPSLTEELEHVPAVAGLSDRSKAEAMDDYVALAEGAGYDESDLLDIGEALDYAAHWLRYSEGKTLVNDALNVGCDDEARHEELVEFLSERAERDVERQLDAVEDHVDHERLASGAHLYRIDLDEYAHRFTYPAPGKTTGELHDAKVKETGDPVITIGYGPDFCVLRSDGVRLDIPNMVTELNEELPEAGVSGGGHLVVGSIKFVKGRRSEVIEALVEKMASAEIDEALSSTIALDD
ncbi:phosphoesterase RecJ domain protein [Halorubrum californiense DSM 19288]|uniref:Phosphoesterase RecJ domain protein n=1 Tax=Halorubrum californiense DSM 19288 TaxID=1227465 RepID=M0EF59_9EURY|nr:MULTISPECIES: OB-fold nucleic acid binding domain-containing protein [Halorubrum]ELZ46400.1 phosphoesterase RecJ domain protein [Halorubrum californiense DSM 19288]TKX67340.1 S1 RNA-binding domain-containing protein [Halorubrum sp. GN11GM_10-3_MGM]